MKLALHLANLTLPGDLGPTLAATARAADEGGFAAITLMDHWFQMENLGGPSQPMIEGYAGLGFLAAHTQNVELGLLVTGVTYRHPRPAREDRHDDRRAVRWTGVPRPRRGLV